MTRILGRAPAPVADGRQLHPLSTINRIPRTWINLVVIIFAGLAESIGITLFVPLIQIMTAGSTTSGNTPLGWIVNIYRALGISVGLMPMLVGIAIMVAGSVALSYLQAVLVIHSRQAYRRDMRMALVDTLFGADWNSIARQSHGEFVNLINQETTRAGEALYQEVMCVAIAVQIIIYFAFSSVLSWQLMVVTVTFAGLVMVVVRPLLRRARMLGAATDRANREINFHTVEHLRASKLIKATSSESTVLRRLHSYIATAFHVAFHTETNAATVQAAIQLLPALLVTSIIALAHEVLALNSATTLVFLVFLARFAPRVAQLQQSYHGYLVHSSAIGIVERAIARQDAGHETSGDQIFRGLSHAIVFAGVSYHYDGIEGPSTLSGISLEIGCNQMVALVGPSGAGKSTLIDMVAGLRHPTAGRILIDGVDLREFTISSWRHRVGYVTQDTIVFNDTLRNNLLFVRPNATDEQIERCLRIAHLWDLVQELPQGLDTMMGEGGSRISGGQRQRLALARALIVEPQVLLLDEATSALDSESEHAIQQALNDVAHQITIVVIAHRLSTVRKADLICVLDGGHIVERGTYADLVQSGGRFAQMHQLQLD